MKILHSVIAFLLLLSLTKAQTDDLSDDLQDEERELRGGRRGRTCKEKLLDLRDWEIFKIGIKRRIGQYCYIEDNVGKPGACSWLAKGKPCDDCSEE